MVVVTLLVDGELRFHHHQGFLELLVHGELRFRYQSFHVLIVY